MLFQDLTRDASLTTDNISKNLEERLKFMLAMEDLFIIIDLWINNRFHEIKFDLFWNELQSYFNEVRFTLIYF